MTGDPVVGTDREGRPVHQCRSTGLLYAWGPRPKHYVSVSGVRLGPASSRKENARGKRQVKRS